MASRKGSSGPVNPKGTVKPKPGRPRMPKGYAIATSSKGLLAWSQVRKRLSSSRNYWVGTTRPDGRPHVMPVSGFWLGDAFYFGTDRNSRKARNLAANPAAVVHLESGDEVAIVEGTAREVTDRSVLEALDKASRAKYGMGITSPPGAVPVIYGVEPRVVFAWRERDLPRSATRWLFPV